MKAKFESFGWEVATVDGHNFAEVEDMLNMFKEKAGEKPKCIIANTIKGKGVSFMEGNAGWHGKAPNDEELRIALSELS